MTKRDTRLSDITCATCGYRLDAASEIGGGNAIPEDGNISVCLNCGQVGFYVTVGDKMTVRSATDQERAELIAKVPELRAAIVAQVALRKVAGPLPTEGDLFIARKEES